MKAFVAVFLVLVFVSACAAPRAAPTAPRPTAAPGALPTKAPAPTSAPKPTAASTSASSATKPAATLSARTPVGSPQPTRAGIAVKDLKQEKQPDGSLRVTANVSVENLGLGQMEVAAPDTMLFDESRSIRLRISPAQQLTALPTSVAPAKTPDLPSFTYRFGGNIDLYPVMFAELRALGFSVDQKGAIRRIVETSKPVEWVWIVKPLAAGRQELSVELSIPTSVGGVASEMTTNVLQNLPLVIQVAAPTPVVIPVATPTTPTLTDRIMDSLIGEFGAVVAAVIGVIGTLIAGILKLRSRKTGL